MPKAPKKAGYKISPDDYHHILESVEIKSLSLISLNYSCDIKELTDPISLGLEMNSVLEGQNGNDVSILFSFRLTGKINKKNVLNIDGGYELHFYSEENFSEEFHEVFRDMSLKLLMIPYLRDLFYNVSLRSDLPAIVLPLMKLFPAEKKMP